MAASTTFSAVPSFPAEPTNSYSTSRVFSRLNLTPRSGKPFSNGGRRKFVASRNVKTGISAKQGDTNGLEYRKLGDSDLVVSEITFGTVRALFTWSLSFMDISGFIMKYIIKYLVMGV